MSFICLVVIFFTRVTKHQFILLSWLLLVSAATDFGQDKEFLPYRRSIPAGYELLSAEYLISPAKTIFRQWVNGF